MATPEDGFDDSYLPQVPMTTKGERPVTIKTVELDMDYEKDGQQDYDALESMFCLSLQDFAQLGKFYSFKHLERKRMLIDLDGISGEQRKNTLVVYVSHAWLPGVNGLEADNQNNDKYNLILHAVNEFMENTLMEQSVEALLWIDFCCMDLENPERRKRFAESLPCFISNADVIFTPILSNKNFKPEQTETIEKGFEESFSNTPFSKRSFDYQVIERDAVIRTEGGHKLEPYTHFKLYFMRAWTRLEIILSLSIPLVRASDTLADTNKIRRLGSERPHIFCTHSDFIPSLYFAPQYKGPMAQELIDAGHGEVHDEEDLKVVKRVLAIGLRKEHIGHDLFEGEVNEKDVAEGFGKMTYSNGEVYEGYWENGLKEGKGTYTYAAGGQYDGDWHRSKKHGSGIMQYPNGDRYEGEFENGVMSGQGILLFANGGQYKGGFKYNKFSGYGVLEIGSIKYSGNFKNNKMSGAGEYIDEDAEIQYEGFMKKDMFHGKGILHVRNEKYDGSFISGKKHGVGTYYYDDHSKYNGTWKKNLKHGRGQYVYSTGNYYEGEFKRDLKHGFGVFVYANGDRYEGEFREDVFHGIGMFEYYRDGSIYKGEWKNGTLDGRGIFYYGRTHDVYKGEWQQNAKHGLGHYFYNGRREKYHGEFVEDRKNGEGIYIFNNGNVYKGHWERDKMSGYGIMSYAKGERYEGMFVDGKRHGVGKIVQGNLEVAGEWDNDVQMDL